MYNEKIKACTLLLNRVISYFKKEFNKDAEEGKG